MKYHNLEELKALIATELDVDEIMDVLGWDIYDLVEALEDIIDERFEDFEDAVRST